MKETRRKHHTSETRGHTSSSRSHDGCYVVADDHGRTHFPARSHDGRYVVTDDHDRTHSEFEITMDVTWLRMTVDAPLFRQDHTMVTDDHDRTHYEFEITMDVTWLADDRGRTHFPARSHDGRYVDGDGRGHTKITRRTLRGWGRPGTHQDHTADVTLRPRSPAKTTAQWERTEQGV